MNISGRRGPEPSEGRLQATEGPAPQPLPLGRRRQRSTPPPAATANRRATITATVVESLPAPFDWLAACEPPAWPPPPGSKAGAAPGVSVVVEATNVVVVERMTVH